MNNYLVSICIPTYNLVNYVTRLLDSIVIQSYKNIEVIISDDSNNDEIFKVIEAYNSKIEIHYFKNNPALKTPKNWNNALAKAKGDLIMLVHQDDYFYSDNSIKKYVERFQENKSLSLVFSKNSPTLDSGTKIPLQANMKMVNSLYKHFEYLVFNYVVGPPSNIMLRKEVKIAFDERFIWLVDVDFCVRLFEQQINYEFINEQLITIGMHDDQATVFCNNNPHIVIKENVLYAAKRPITSLNYIKLFDYYWRFIRNFKIRKVETLFEIGLKKEEIIFPFKLIIDFQSKIPVAALKVGIISKLLMFLTYIRFRLSLY